ncbi:uncharacterized protein LOC115072643 [Nannospalax galili]|uniref:uncharacterized protein LOC115072643 n=1 Tax=Nannospalax galili TaxID=1026970 RepID=UPI00111C7A59|nr:uncharacterized protein LOC115072643 [Nannospalax galili]
MLPRNRPCWKEGQRRLRSRTVSGSRGPSNNQRPSDHQLPTARTSNQLRGIAWSRPMLCTRSAGKQQAQTTWAGRGAELQAPGSGPGRAHSPIGHRRAAKALHPNGPRVGGNKEANAGARSARPPQTGAASWNGPGHVQTGAPREARRGSGSSRREDKTRVRAADERCSSRQQHRAQSAPFPEQRAAALGGSGCSTSALGN